MCTITFQPIPCNTFNIDRMILQRAYLGVLLFFIGLAHACYAQDTISTTLYPDSTFLGKTQKTYNKMYYFFYGRFILKGNKKHADTNYIRSYPEYMVLTAELGYPYLSHSITSPEAEETIDYIGNISSTLGFRFGYKNISFGYRFKLKSSLDDADDLASTSYNSFNLKFQNNKLNHTFLISRLQGLTDVSADNNAVGKERYYRREDIVLTSLSYTLIGNLSWKKYSYLAPRTYSQRQIKSRVGFLWKAGFVVNSFAGDSALVNPLQQRYFRSFRDVKEFSGIALQVSPGVGGNLVFAKRFYMSALLFLGADYYHYAYKRMDDEDDYRSSSVQLSIDGEASIGYQAERFFTGFHLEWKSLNAKINDASLLWYNAYIGIKAGYRINAPSLVKKSYQVVFPY